MRIASLKPRKEANETTLNEISNARPQTNFLGEGPDHTVPSRLLPMAPALPSRLRLLPFVLLAALSTTAADPPPPPDTHSDCPAGSGVACGPGNEKCGPPRLDGPKYHVTDLTCNLNDPNGPFYDPVHGNYHLF